MKARVAVVLVLAAGVLVAGSAAAAAPSCRIVKDRTGDTYAVSPQNAPPAGSPVHGPQDDYLDLVNADLASDGKNLTAVVRVRKLARTSTTSPLATTYALTFSVPGRPGSATLRAQLHSKGAAYEALTTSAADVSTYLGPALGAIDFQKNEVRMTVPVSVFKSYAAIKRGTKLKPVETTTGRGTSAPALATPGAPAPSRGLDADIATGGKTYAVGARSCLRVGG